jgi:hypothetical protein
MQFGYKIFVISILHISRFCKLLKITSGKKKSPAFPPYGINLLENEEIRRVKETAMRTDKPPSYDTREQRNKT